jgi:hypothetical protein
MRLWIATVCGVVTVAGFALVAKALTLPYAERCDAAAVCAGNHLPALLSDENYGVSPWSAVPVAAMVLAIMAAAGLIVARRPRWAAAAAGVQTIAGASALAFFTWLLEQMIGAGRPGPVVGAAGGVLITLSGLAALGGVLYISRTQPAQPVDR